MKNTIAYCLILVSLNFSACSSKEESKVWKKMVLSNEEVLKEVKAVTGGERLTTECLSAYLPVKIGETIHSVALLEADENSGEDRLKSMITKPYFKGLNSVTIKVTDYIDIKRLQSDTLENIELEYIITKTYLNNEGLRITEKYLYDSNYVKQSQLEISDKRFVINIIAKGESVSPAPLPQYLFYVFQNSDLPRLFDLSTRKVKKNSF